MAPCRKTSGTPDPSSSNTSRRPSTNVVRVATCDPLTLASPRASRVASPMSVPYVPSSQEVPLQGRDPAMEDARQGDYWTSFEDTPPWSF